MNPNDKDLKNLLKPLKDLSPTDLQMQKWQKAVQAELKPQASKASANMKWAFQLMAATLIGFIVGALIFKNHSEERSSSRIAQISLDDATYERSHDNLD